MIDTLKLARRLTDAGMPRGQAEVITEELESGLKESAVTKADLAVTEAGLTAAISKSKIEMILWQIGIAFVLYGALRLTH